MIQGSILRVFQGYKGPRFLARSLGTSPPPTPDYNTPVDVANIRLSKQPRKSLVPSTLKEMAGDAEFQLSSKRLKEMGQKKLTLEERKQRRRALDNLGVPSFASFLAEQRPRLEAVRRKCEVLQLNIGLYCNQACNHCHVESSPERTEMMSAAVAERCLALLEASPSVTTLDITGGAPELNAQFRPLVAGARALADRTGRRLEIIDRCNLTVLAEPGQEDLPSFLAEHGVRVAASLPCYSAKNVDMQRGNKVRLGFAGTWRSFLFVCFFLTKDVVLGCGQVFKRSIAGLRMLNEAGFGAPGSGLGLDLVYNPLGAFLPPPQEALEAKYKEELREHFGVAFSGLFTMTNMPIKRFADLLHRRGELQAYLDLLVRNFNPDTVPCAHTPSVQNPRTSTFFPSFFRTLPFVVARGALGFRLVGSELGLERGPFHGAWWRGTGVKSDVRQHGERRVGRKGF